MASIIQNISMDCADPYSLCEFWSKVLDTPMDPVDSPGDDEVGFDLDSGQTLLYGNATNERPSGHGVIPSQSPGPWVNNPNDPDNPARGRSLGQLIQEFDFNAGQLRGMNCPFE